MTNTTHLRTSFGDIGWPTCYVCKKPVSHIQYEENRLDLSVTITACCHGKSEKITLTHRDLIEMMSGASMILGEAFRPVLEGPL
jgi:hypothetical protein